MDEHDQTALLARAVEGETEAFRSLYDSHHAALFRFAYRLTGAVAVAEDLTQECFVRLIRSTRFNKQRRSLRQYLYGIMRNLVRQREKEDGGRVNSDAECSPMLTVASFADSLSSQELDEAVQAAISALPPLQREVIVLCEFEELSLLEAVAVIGADVGAIKSRLHRAR